MMRNYPAAATAPAETAMAPISHSKNGHSPATTEPALRDKPEYGLASESLDDPGAKLATEVIAPMAPQVPREHTTALVETPDSLPHARSAELTKRESQEIADHKLRQPVQDEVLEDGKVNPENGAHYADGAAAAASAIAEKPNAVHLSAPVEHSEETANPAMTTFSEFLNTVRGELLRAIGPIAPIVLREHVRALGDFSGSFPKAKLEALAKELGREIANDDHRQRFEKELSEAIQKLGSQANGGLSGRPRTHDNGPAKPAAEKEERDTPEVLQIISAKLAEAIGPMAPLILRDGVAALGETAKTFKEARIGELIIQVSAAITVESSRRQFHREMSREMQKLKERRAKSREAEVSRDELKSKWLGIESWRRTAKS